MPPKNFFSRKPLSSALRLLVVAALSVSAAHADDYTDVSRLISVGQFHEALAWVDQYLAAKPRDPQMRFFKGVIQTETGKATEAIATFIKISEDYPEAPEPYNNVAVLYAGQSEFHKALDALEMAIRAKPNYATAYENRGDVYAKLASQAYSKALQLDGGNSAVPPKLAMIATLFTPEAKAQKPAAAAPAAPAVTAQTPAAPAKPAAVIPATPAAPAPAAPTPPATPAAPAPAAATPVSAAEKEVEAAVRAWASAWAGKDMTAYLAAYGKDFDTPGNQPRKAWEEERRSRIVGKSKISMKINNLSVDVKGSKATAKFRQDYSADALNISSLKTLDLAKVGDSWVIVKESTGW